MRSRILSAVIVFFAVVSAAGAQQKRRVAVIDFDYATVQSQVSSVFGTNKDVGKGIVDLLVDKLVSDGVFSVIERNALDKIIAESVDYRLRQFLSKPSDSVKASRIDNKNCVIYGERGAKRR